jgi:putative membrane protein
MRLLVQIVLNALALLLVDQLLPGLRLGTFGDAFGTFVDALLAALLIGLLNALVRPILLLLTLPITLLTLGLFYFVLNALIFWFAAYLLPGFTVDSFLTALVSSLLYSLLTTLISRVFRY